MKNRRVTFAAMAVLVVAVAVAGPSQAHEAPRLVEYLPGAAHVPGGAGAPRAEFSSLPSETLDALRDDPSAAELQVGMANPDAVRNARALSLALPGLANAGPARVVSFGALEISERSEHDYSVYGRDAAAQSEVSLVVMGQDVVGTVTHDGDTWDLRPLGGGLTAVYRRDPQPVPAEFGVWGVERASHPRAARAGQRAEARYRNRNRNRRRRRSVPARYRRVGRARGQWRRDRRAGRLHPDRAHPGREHRRAHSPVLRRHQPVLRQQSDPAARAAGPQLRGRLPGGGRRPS